MINKAETFILAALAQQDINPATNIGSDITFEQASLFEKKELPHDKLLVVTSKINNIVKSLATASTRSLYAGSLVMMPSMELLRRMSPWHARYVEEGQQTLYIIHGFGNQDRGDTYSVVKDYFIQVPTEVINNNIEPLASLMLDGEKIFVGREFLIDDWFKEVK